MGLAGWTVRLTGTAGDGSTVDTTTVTGAGGYYEFTDLKPGTYKVVEVQQTGWDQYYPPGNMHDGIALVSGRSPMGPYNFGNWHTTTELHGYKYEDKNGDGDWDTGEPGLAGWTINLTGTDVTGAQVTSSTVTGAGGYYEFTPLMPGTYAVSETLKPGWKQTDPGTPSGHTGIVLPPDGESTSYDFGNCELVDLEGHKYEDADADGSVDASDTGLAGWTITLTGTTGSGASVNESTTTGAGGYYKFENLEPGTYEVDEVQQTGWTQSYPASGSHSGIGVESGDDTKGPYDFGNYEKTGSTATSTRTPMADGSIAAVSRHRRLDDPPDGDHR